MLNVIDRCARLTANTPYYHDYWQTHREIALYSVNHDAFAALDRLITNINHSAMRALTDGQTDGTKLIISLLCGR